MIGDRFDDLLFLLEPLVLLAQRMRNEPVPRFASGRIGRPRIVSQPRRSTSKGFIRIATAGHSQLTLCWSMALLIASRFLASEPTNPES